MLMVSERNLKPVLNHPSIHQWRLELLCLLLLSSLLQLQRASLIQSNQLDYRPHLIQLVSRLFIKCGRFAYSYT